jgi:RNA polymerase sigma-70 factor (ECF subfamily)
MNIEHLWIQLHEPLKGFVAKRISDVAAVEDIVQDVFIKIATNLDTLKEEEKVHTWIYKITRHAIIDFYRKQRPMEELPKQLQGFDDYEDADQSKELSVCIRPMIDQLPGIYKEAIELTELNGMTQKQLSERLGISFSGAKSRVQRGREKLKELLTACCHIEADRYGHIIDFRKKKVLDKDCSSSCGCP